MIAVSGQGGSEPGGGASQGAAEVGEKTTGSVATPMPDGLRARRTSAARQTRASSRFRDIVGKQTNTKPDDEPRPGSASMPRHTASADTLAAGGHVDGRAGGGVLARALEQAGRARHRGSDPRSD